ncbi:hypothetical protein K1719_035344 [Acacia pycnantha]|nr:hypothetical protein K1719_035344 [Acacia pycnantha]
MASLQGQGWHLDIGDSKSTWKVLIMDKLTVKIISHSCKMADITDEGVSLVEDLYKRRQAFSTMDAIYFIQPTKENVIIFLSDMSGKAPLYRKAFVFFSSPISKELVMNIKKDTMVLPRISALREMNLEYFAIDSQGFITNHDRALEDLFGNEENNYKGVACLNEMATRIATVFASLREYPFVCYRAAKSLDATTMTTSIDQIAPVIHEWTYDAICHDLLNLEGNKYVHEVPGKNGGPPEKKEVLLEGHDPIWLELRPAHIADASERLHEKMTNFVSKNKAAQIQHGSRDTGDMSFEQMDKLSLHVEIAGKINRIIRELGLRELGQMEQDLVFGDAGTKDVIKFLTANEDRTRENKLRLLMILAAIYPEKFEGEKGLNMMKVAGLTREDMTAVNNMKLLGTQPEATTKGSTASFSFKFDIHKAKKKKKRAARIDRPGETETWQLSRFYPIIEELVEKLSKNELSKEDYPCLNDPSPTFHNTYFAGSLTQDQHPHSKRSIRTPSWARSRGSDDRYSSDSSLRRLSSDLSKMGQRIFVFIVGGATRSELRACHKLTGKLKREVVLGSSSIDDPAQFIMKLKTLSSEQELSVDDLEI